MERGVHLRVENQFSNKMLDGRTRKVYPDLTDNIRFPLSTNLVYETLNLAISLYS